jgi:hypothetical protein
VDALLAIIVPVFGLLICGLVFLISAVAAQELGRFFLRRTVNNRASGLAGVVGAFLTLMLAVLCFEAWFHAR